MKDALFEVGERYGLDDVGGRALVHGHAHILGVVLHGRHDDGERCESVILAALDEKSVAILAGHIPIEQDQMKGLAPGVGLDQSFGRFGACYGD